MVVKFIWRPKLSYDKKIVTLEFLTLVNKLVLKHSFGGSKFQQKIISFPLFYSPQPTEKFE